MTLVRPIRMDGSPLFREIPKLAINMVFWKFGPLNAEGKPTSMSIGAGGRANEDGNLEMCVDEEKNYFLITSDDFTEGFAGEIPNDLKNLDVFPVQLVPTARARFRLVDADGKPLAGQEVFAFVNVRNRFDASSGGLRVGDVLRTDEDGLITVPVPALGDLKERYYYRLQLSLLKQNTNVEISGNLDFAPEKSGETLDVQELHVEMK